MKGITVFLPICIGILVGIPSSLAGVGGMTSLKKVQVTEGSQVDLLFDGKVAKGQVKLEFINDIIQLSLSDVSVYPAKIFSVSGSELTKVFAYQYAPKLVRTRLTVRGKAESYKDRVQLRTDGKLITVRLLPLASDRVAGSSASATRAAGAAEASPGAAPAAAEGAKAGAAKADSLSADEKILLDRVLKSGGSDKPAADADNAKAPIGRDAGAAPVKLSGAKPLPSLMRTLGALAAILALFGGLAYGLKRLRGLGAGGQAGKLGKFLKAGLGGLAAKEKMIEVVANHYLGPKKSISVVRVCGRILVLGVSNDAINLIAQFSGDGKDAQVNSKAYEEMDLDAFMKSEASMAAALLDDLAPGQQQGKAAKAAPQPAPGAGMGAAAGAAAYGAAGPSAAGATAAGKPVFSDILKGESSRTSVRAQIRSKVEGLKQL